MTDNDKAVIAGLEAMGFRLVRETVVATEYEHAPSIKDQLVKFQVSITRQINLIGPGYRIHFLTGTPPAVILAAVKAAVESDTI